MYQAYLYHYIKKKRFSCQLFGCANAVGFTLPSSRKKHYLPVPFASTVMNAPFPLKKKQVYK